jgi:putative transposase
MRKAMKYRLFPTKKQAHALAQALDACRWVWNKTLEVRKTAWETEQRSVSYFETKRLLPEWKAEHPFLNAAHSQVLQNVTERVDLAFQAFFRRVHAGEEPGYPRFRGKGRYDSMTFPQYGNGCQMTDNSLKLSKVGAIHIKAHRPLKGTPKTCTIRRTATGKWYATIACEVDPQPLSPSAEEVGIDVGLTSFFTLSTGERTPCPKFLRTDEKDLKRAQRKCEATPKGMPERAKRRKIVARIHERIANGAATSAIRKPASWSTALDRLSSKICPSARWCTTTVSPKASWMPPGHSSRRCCRTKQYTLVGSTWL